MALVRQAKRNDNYRHLTGPLTVRAPLSFRWLGSNLLDYAGHPAKHPALALHTSPELHRRTVRALLKVSLGSAARNGSRVRPKHVGAGKKKLGAMTGQRTKTVNVDSLIVGQE